MEVDSNTAQVEALMNLIRSTYPQIVRELSQLSNTVSDGEPPWKKQRMDRTYANNDNRGESKNVLGDVYKYSVVNNINLAFNFTLANGDSRMTGFDISGQEDRSLESRLARERTESHNSRKSVAKPSNSPQDIMVNGTAPAEVITDPQLLRNGLQAHSRLVEIYRCSGIYSKPPLHKQGRRLRKLSALLKLSQWTAHDSDENVEINYGSSELEIQDADFFVPGTIFEAEYRMPNTQLSIPDLRFYTQGPFKFLVVHKGLYCCSVLPIGDKAPSSVPPQYGDGEMRREIGAFCKHDKTKRNLEPPYCDRYLRIVDIDQENWRTPEWNEFRYSTVLTIDVTIRARALARVAEESLDDLDAQFQAYWNHSTGADGLQRRNSALD